MVSASSMGTDTRQKCEWEGGRRPARCRLGGCELTWRHTGAILMLKEPHCGVYSLRKHERNELQLLVRKVEEVSGRICWISGNVGMNSEIDLVAEPVLQLSKRK